MGIEGESHRSRRMPGARGEALATGPVAALRADHDKIEIVLDAWEAMAEAALVGAFADAPRLRDSVRFMREFTDESHHAKEEDALFPALAEKGLSQTEGPIGRIKLEHDLGRKWLHLLETVLESDAMRLPGDWREIARLSFDYVRLLRGHIRMENHSIFLIAEELLDADGMARLAVEFTRMDAEWMRRHGMAGRARIETVLRDCAGYLDTVWTRG